MNSTRSAERYIAGRMEEEEQRQFEITMLEQPDLAAEVDARQRIKAGLQRLEQRGELEALTTRPAQRHYVRYAAAAGVLLALAAGVAYWNDFRTARPAIAGSLQALVGGGDTTNAISGTYLLASTRTRSGKTRITVKRDAGAVRLQVVPDAGDAPSFSVSLVAISGGSETTIADGVRVQGAGLVEVFLNPTVLESGQYRLRLAPKPAGGAVTDYSFELNIERND